MACLLPMDHLFDVRRSGTCGCVNKRFCTELPTVTSTVCESPSLTTLHLIVGVIITLPAKPGSQLICVPQSKLNLALAPQLSLTCPEATSLTTMSAAFERSSDLCSRA